MYTPHRQKRFSSSSCFRCYFKMIRKKKNSSQTDLIPLREKGVPYRKVGIFSLLLASKRLSHLNNIFRDPQKVLSLPQRTNTHTQRVLFFLLYRNRSFRVAIVYPQIDIGKCNKTNLAHLILTIFYLQQKIYTNKRDSRTIFGELNC